MVQYFNSGRMPEGGYLITNDFGKYAFIDTESYRQLCDNTLSPDSELYAGLREKGFIFDGSVEAFAKEWSEAIQGMKSYCFSGTSLHIFAVTNACNLDCRYCQAHSKDSALTGMMDPETGRRAVEVALQSPNKHLTFEFQGGEPLLNFNTIRDMVLYSKEINRDKCIDYTVVSNLTLLTDEMLDFFSTNGVSICTSLDGPEVVHDFNRPYRGSGGGSYRDVIRKINHIRNKGINVNAIQTTTRKSLKYHKEIVDEYLNLGMDQVFVRPLTPLGLADTSWADVGYSEQEFLEFYRCLFDHIMKLNISGTRFVETQATFFLRKILYNNAWNYMELRSPCGASLGQMSYYYDGNVYTCDEGRMMSEMGNDSFLLGNVYEDSYADLVRSPVCQTICKASIIESIPKCNDCVYQPYCGTCPVVNYATTNDLYAKNRKDYRCATFKAIMEILFEILRRNDEEEIRVLYSWIE